MIDIRLIDYLKLMESIPDSSIDFAFFDPPYGVLTGHKIEQKINISALFSHLDRVVKKGGFVAFFGQMPTLINWCVEANKYFIFHEHISWVKRNITSPYLDIQRSHESMMIYKKSNEAKYYETSEKYEDLKTPAMWMGLYELSTYMTTISDLQRRLHDRKYDDLYFSGLPTSNGAESSNDAYYKKKYRVKENFENEIAATQKRENDGSNRKDDFHKKVFGSQKRQNKKELRDAQPCNDDLYSNRYPNVQSFRYRSKWLCNITNVWSFLPENQKSFGRAGVNIKHPTVKPIRLALRAVKLCTKEGDTVLDMFSGSGTTALACKMLNRNFIGSEIDADYYEDSIERVSGFNDLFTCE